VETPTSPRTGKRTGHRRSRWSHTKEGKPQSLPLKVLRYPAAVSLPTWARVVQHRLRRPL